MKIAKLTAMPALSELFDSYTEEALKDNDRDFETDRIMLAKLSELLDFLIRDFLGMPETGDFSGGCSDGQMAVDILDLATGIVEDICREHDLPTYEYVDLFLINSDGEFIIVIEDTDDEN